MIVIAPKKEYSSMDDFVAHALDYLESHPDFCDAWNIMYQNRIYQPIDEQEKKWMLSRFDEMNQRISVAYDTILRADYIIPPEGNDITIGIETASEYIFYEWGTSA